MTANSGLRIENKDTLHLKVCNAIRQAIISGELKPGERLKQSELADQLGVSRMPVREALQKLETEGLVVIEPHKGAIVKSISVSDIEEIYSLRAELEKMAIYQSVDLFTNEDILQLSVLVDRMEAAQDVDEFIADNIEFHKLLVKRCSWERLKSFIGNLWNGFPQQTPHVIAGQMETSNVEHREILNAIKARDKETAANLLSEHINRTRENLINNIK